MKNKSIFLMAICAMLLLFSGCSKKNALSYYDFKTKLIGTELDGSYTFTAWGRARHAVDAYNQAQKQAVYDVLFTGAEPQSSNLRRLQPLLLEVNARDKYQDYFDAFFADNGPYKEYCSMKDKRVESSEFYKNKRQAVCKATVMVYRSKLRSKLIQDNILKTNE